MFQVCNKLQYSYYVLHILLCIIIQYYKKLDFKKVNLFIINNFIMDNSEIFNKVKKVVVEKLGANPSNVSMESTFIGDLGADSLDTVELIMDLEEDFGIEIPDEEAEKLKTVGDVVTYIEDKTK